MNELSGALSVLSAMITPAVLILASSSLILATSARLSRAVDRTRSLMEDFEALVHDAPAAEIALQRRSLLYDQLAKSTARARLLQRAMTSLYLGLSLFLATSVAIGVGAATRQAYAWLVIALGLGGVGLLLFASVLLIIESRVTLAAIDSEMDFILRMGASIAPAELLDDRRLRGHLFRKPDLH